MSERPRPARLLDLSIVIPTRNESLRLPQTLREARCDLARQGIRAEVVIADDGSSDGTPEVARQLVPELPLAVVCPARRRGVGAAVRAGMLAAAGHRLLLCDADGAVPFAELWRLWSALDAGHDIAVGSRLLAPESIEVPQPRHRVVMGKAWSRLVDLLVPTAVRDTQCGFKLFERAAGRTLFSLAITNSFAFYVEVLSLARAMDYRVAEIPVRWRDRPGSKIKLLRDPAHMLCDLARIRVGRRNQPARHQQPAPMPRH